MTGLMVGLLAETFVHPGSGQTDGAIDLRVAREVITGYPFVPGSAMKGALKSHCVDNGLLDDKGREDMFGRMEAAGQILVSDARLLLLPVRSLSKAFFWITCPLMLERLSRDRQRLGLDSAKLEEALATMPIADLDGQADDNTEFLLCSGAEAGHRVFLEERLLTVAGALPGWTSKKDPGPVVQAILDLIPHDGTRRRLGDQLAIVSDHMFGWFARNGLPVQARNALDDTTKASESLWYEETLAPDTLMYATLSPRGGAVDAFVAVKQALTSIRYLQVGGNETIGQGWMATQWCETEVSAASREAVT